jgi:ABC-type Zn uptake system ZnuABC Zn-binding protein ZnuA
MKKLLLNILLLFIIISTLSSCAVKKQVIAYTVYPVGYLLDRIAGEKIEKYQIQEDKIIQLAQIDSDYKTKITDNQVFLFHIGDLEPYLSLYNNELKENGVTYFDLSSKNATYEFKKYTIVYVNDKANYIEGPYYQSDVFDDVDTYYKDLSLWLSPIGMLSMAVDIKDYLASNYFEESTTFENNYTLLENDLVRLDAEYQILSKELQNENKTVKFVSITPSFGNWQKDYGFQVYPVILSKYGVLPNEEQIEVIKQRIIKDEVKYIAYEPNMTADMIEIFNRLQEELGLTRVNMNNLSCLTNSQKEDNKDYLSIMYENLSVLENMATDNIVDESSDSGSIEEE